MGTFSVISQDAFSEFQVDAGVLLNFFDPADPGVDDEEIICATTGGINPSCVPSFVDWGEDVDNCPNNMMELKKISGYECSLGFTALKLNIAVAIFYVVHSNHRFSYLCYNLSYILQCWVFIRSLPL